MKRLAMTNPEHAQLRASANNPGQRVVICATARSYASQLSAWICPKVTRAPFYVLVALLLFVGGSLDVRGQVAFDAASSADTGSGTATSLTFSHTVTTTGSNRILIVGVSIGQQSTRSVSSVTYAGTNLTLVGTRTVSGEVRIEIWHLVAPATGTNDVVVTMSGSSEFVAGASSFANVDQTTPLGTFFSAVGDSDNPSVNVTGVNVNEVVIDTLGIGNDLTATVGTGQTQRWNRRTTDDDVRGAGSTEPRGGSSTVTMSWSLSEDRDWAIGAVALKPAPAAPGGISGTVFEDVNYGGGAGMGLAASAGSPRSNARVELYDGSGTFVSSTLANASGAYTFSGLAAGNYTVRVVNSTVTSSRTGYVITLLPVQTFRTDAGSGSSVADTNRVGGEDPTKADAASNTTNATLASLTTASTTAQSIAPVTVSSAVITGVDFGFNFDTIVNINNAGQGSLRQFVTNSNALGNGGLAQAGLSAAVETSIFMISDGAAHSGLRAGLVNQITGGVAIIALTSLLPQITAASTAIDGSTQTSNVGNTNSGTLGTGGTVGVDGLSLQTVNRPEVQLGDNGGLAIGLDVQANSVTVRGLAIFGFGTTANSNNHANIRIGNNYSATLIEQNVLGATATSFTDPGAGARSVGDNIRSVGADSGTVRNNLIGFSNGKGIQLGTASTGWLIENNEVRNNGIGNSNLDGIDIENSGGNTVRGNWFSGNEAPGVDMYQSSGANMVQNNTVTANGFGPGANVETPGVRVYGSGNTIDRNIINANFGAGVIVTSGSTGNTITRNSIYGNGPTSNQIGIDLLTATENQSTGTAPFVTVNDSGDGDAGGNNLLNYPVLLTAISSGGNLTLTGYARPGSAIELFIAAVDPSGFGEGQTYLVTLIEGSAADTDATTGTYTNPVNGLNQGTDTTNKFSFTIPLPAGVNNGSILTATATLASNTSEFSGNVTVLAPMATHSVTGTVFEDVNYGGGAGTSLASSSGSARSNARVELYDGSGNFVSSTTTNASGSYTFTGLAAGSYTVRVVNSTVSSSRSGYVSTLIPVQTFRTDASSGSAVADTNRVGGEVPSKADAASNTTNATLASLTTASVTAQSIAPVPVSSADITGVDFGFNFDTIVNISNAGQGSLHQFVTNSNALVNGGLAQAGLTAGVETSIFMISDGAAHPGLRAGLTNLFSGGTATIILTSALPNITDANTAIDGTRQTAITGNTNPAVNETTTGPEITLNVAAGPGLQTTAANTLFDSLGLTGANGAGTTGSGVYFNGAGVAGSIIRNSTVWNNDDRGITLRNGATNVQILNNISRNNGVVANDANGIELFGASNLTISDNQLLNNTGYGIDLRTAANNTNTITNNLIKANGFGTSDNDAGIGLRVGSNNIISLNTITGNQGDGIVVNSGTGNTITQNSIYGNGDLGIDLGGGNTGNGVTINDTGDVDAGPNNVQNFPVLESTVFLGPSLRLTGYARPGSVIEVFIAAPDANGFGEGQTYLTTLTEGSAQDADSTSGNYANPFGGLNQGTDTTNRFSFTIPVPAGVNFGTVLTTTATLGGNTSEFSGNATVVGVPPVPSIELVKSVNPSGTQAPGADLTYTVSFENTGTSAASTFTITDQIPANTDFKIGSIVNNLGSTGLNPILEYSTDNGATWTYTPVSGAGGAPAGYDRVATHVRWRFLGDLLHIASQDSGDVGFTVRIR